MAGPVTGPRADLDAPIHDQATIRNTADDDEDRITRRVHAALNSGQRDAVVAVVLDETGDTRKTVELVRDLADQWSTVDPSGLMSRVRAAETLRQVIGE